MIHFIISYNGSTAVAGYFKLMLLGTYTIIVFECRTHSSLKWPPLMIQINLLALDTQTVFNLEIMESGSNVPRDILNWVISKMVWVKLL